MKKYLYLFLSGLLVLILVLGFAFKNKLNEFISTKMQEQNSEITLLTVEETIQKEYNFLKNGEDFEYTLLEFSSSGCAICKQMEPVLDEIRISEQVKMKVVFLHIMKPENQDLMKFYGISAVPMQILLDKQGKEFYRHYGFISAQDLFAETTKI